MIRITGLTKRYDAHHAGLADLDLEVDRGEFVFVTGPSGAGKTTLLRMLLRQQTPTSGKIVVSGRDITALPARRVPSLRRFIGVVFQDFKLIQRKTALENVAYVLNVAGIPPAERQRRAYNALRSVGLNHKLQALPSVLSGGEQQRVAIARAIVNEPKLLLADEPTGNLDPKLAIEIMRLFREINARGTTVLVATHDQSLIQRMQCRTVVLRHGRVVDDGHNPEQDPPQ